MDTFKIWLEAQQSSYHAKELVKKRPDLAPLMRILTLSKLSSMLGISGQALNQYFSRHRDLSFFDTLKLFVKERTTKGRNLPGLKKTRGGWNNRRPIPGLPDDVDPENEEAIERFLLGIIENIFLWDRSEEEFETMFGDMKRFKGIFKDEVPPEESIPAPLDWRPKPRAKTWMPAQGHSQVRALVYKYPKLIPFFRAITIADIARRLGTAPQNLGLYFRKNEQLSFLEGLKAFVSERTPEGIFQGARSRPRRNLQPLRGIPERLTANDDKGIERFILFLLIEIFVARKSKESLRKIFSSSQEFTDIFREVHPPESQEIRTVRMYETPQNPSKWARMETSGSKVLSLELSRRGWDQLVNRFERDIGPTRGSTVFTSGSPTGGPGVEYIEKIILDNGLQLHSSTEL